MSKKEQVQFYGIDSFGRPVFRSLKFKKNFFGSTDILFDDEATEEEVLAKIKAEDLLFFGSYFGCEPMGVWSMVSLEIVPKTKIEEHSIEVSPPPTPKLGDMMLIKGEIHVFTGEKFENMDTALGHALTKIKDLEEELLSAYRSQQRLIEKVRHRRDLTNKLRKDSKALEDAVDQYMQTKDTRYPSRERRIQIFIDAYGYENKEYEDGTDQ